MIIFNPFCENEQHIKWSTKYFYLFLEKKTAQSFITQMISSWFKYLAPWLKKSFDRG